MKYLSSLISFLCLTAVTFSVSAQKLAGEWKKYQVIKPYIQRVISTPGNLYYISTDRLFSYDSQSGKSRIIGDNEGLMIGDISAVKYNHDKGYLALGSYDGSIGLVYDDGRTVNFPAIKTISVPTSKSINDIDFYGDDIYMATDFGLVIIDASKGTIKNYTRPSSNFKTNMAFKSVVAMPGYALGLSGKTLYAIPTDNRMTDLSNLKKINLSLENVQLFGRGDGTFYISTYPDNGNSSSKKYLRLYRFDSDNSQCQLVNDYNLTPLSNIWIKNGIYMVEVEDGSSKVATYDISSASEAPVKLETGGNPWMSTDYSYDPESKKKIIATSTGVKLYDNGNMSGSFVAEIPDDFTSVESVSILYPSIDRKRIYVSTRSSSNKWKTAGNNYNPELNHRRPLPLWAGWVNSMKNMDMTSNSDAYGFFVPTYVNLIADGKVSDISNYDPSNHYGNKNKVDQDHGGYWLYFLQAYNALGNVVIGGEGVTENPLKPGQYWHAANAEGLYVMDGGTEQRILSNETGTMKSRNQWGTQIMDVKFDKEGNVWILTPTVHRAATWPGKLPSSVLQMLPASKVADIDAITADDWKEANQLPVGKEEYSGQIDGTLTITHNRVDNGAQSEYIFVKPLVYHGLMIVYRRMSQGDDVSNDYPVFITKIVDQNGNEYSVQEMNHIQEDLQGRVWLSNLSFFGYFDTSIELEEGATTLPIIVPADQKRGGSPVDNANIIGVSQSPVDRTLWVASQGNGLFHLNYDGTEQLENFRTSNSILTTDILGAVCVDASGDVYIGSQKGLFRYRPTHGASAADLSNVMVDPAVAKDGYNGAFTISNLTESCPVTIKDTQGNVVFKGTSSGGTLIWDGLDMNDRRVVTGTYSIVAGNPEQTVAKIVVME